MNTDPTFRQHLKDLLKDTARRYGSNPDVAFVDLGTVGALLLLVTDQRFANGEL